MQTNIRPFLFLHPALEMAFFVLFGISFYFQPYVALFPMVLYVGMVAERKIPLKMLFISGAVFLLQCSLYGFRPPTREEKGTAELRIQHLSRSKSHFRNGRVLKGKLKKFTGESGCIRRNLPFTLYLPAGEILPPIGFDYHVEGRLLPNEAYGFTFTVDKGASFIPSGHKKSLAEIRYRCKQRVSGFLETVIPFKKAASLLVGMTTGEFNDPYLFYTFSRFGLSHLLALSGFHFGILVFFLYRLLYFPFSVKVRAVFLFFFTTLFYLFIGPGPSLSRAWITVSIYLAAVIIERKALPIHTLSLAFSIVLLSDPFLLFHMGFQFSFLVTYAILFYHRPTVALISLLCKGRRVRKMIDVMALGAAVHLAALPLSLYHFHKFYWFGFLYNLFVPAYLALLIGIFLASVPLYFFLPGPAGYLFHCVGFMTEKMLSFIYEIPVTYDYCLRVSRFPLLFLILYIGLFFYVGCCLQAKRCDSPRFRVVF